METIPNFKVMSEDDMSKLIDKIEGLSMEMKEMANKAINPMKERWIDNDEACSLLRVSPRTLQNYRDKGVLPYSMIRGKVFFKASDIEAVLEENYTAKR